MLVKQGFCLIEFTLRLQIQRRPFQLYICSCLIKDQSITLWDRYSNLYALHLLLLLYDSDVNSVIVSESSCFLSYDPWSRLSVLLINRSEHKVKSLFCVGFSPYCRISCIFMWNSCNSDTFRIGLGNISSVFETRFVPRDTLSDYIMTIKCKLQR